MDHGLQGLVSELVAAVSAAASEGLQKVQTDWTRIECIYEESSLVSQYVAEVRESWDTVQVAAIVKSVSGGSARYEEAALRLAESSDVPIPEVRGHLNGLLGHFACLVADGTPEVIPEKIDQFVEELAGKPIEWRGEAWLLNVTVAGDPLKVNDELTLRAPESKDFEDAFPTAAAPLRASTPGRGKPLMPHSVLEVSATSATRPEELVTRFANTVCLFCLSGAVQSRVRFRSSSLLSGRGIESSRSIGSQLSPRFTLTPALGPKLSRFHKKTVHLLPLKPTGQHSERKWNGIKYYFKAIHQAQSDEDSLAEAVAAIEGILSPERGEMIKRKVSQRTAALLGGLGYRRMQVRDDLEEAYRIRSLVRHGNELKPKHRQDLPALAKTVLDYARLVVVADLDLRLLKSEPFGREELANLLDDSLLQSEARAAVQERLKGGVLDLVVKP